MQAAVDALAGPVAGSNASATLQQVCYKPLGDDCATQSILQVCYICASRPRYSMPLIHMEAAVSALEMDLWQALALHCYGNPEGLQYAAGQQSQALRP